MKNKKATMREVADRAGVALSTVSHVINGTASISDATIEKINNVIKELNYTPNAMARALRADRSNVIGIIVPDITNEFYSRFAAELLKIAANKGIVANILNTDYDYKREKIGIESFIMSRLDGVVFLGGGQDENLIDEIDNSGIPVVLADRRYKDFARVEFNNEEIMQQMAFELKDKGYTSIGYVSEKISMINLTDRLNGIKVGAKKAGISIVDNWMIDDINLRFDKLIASDAIMKKAIKAIKLSNKASLPDVIAVSSDLIAVGVITALINSGYNVPEDVAVIGYDDTVISNYFKPSITTVRQDYKAAAREVFRLLEGEISKNNKNRSVVIKNSIIYRETTR